MAMDLSITANVPVKLEPEHQDEGGSEKPFEDKETQLTDDTKQISENSESIAQIAGTHFLGKNDDNKGHKFDFSKHYEEYDLVRSSSGKFLCRHCKYSTKSTSNIKRHLLTHSGKKPFSCPKCNYSCSSKSNLMSHTLAHNGGKPFACANCNYTSSDKSTMNRHMLTHSGEKPFSCTDCSYAGSRKTHLRRHMLTHSGEKPFSCLECNYACSDRSLLKRHMLTCHSPVSTGNVNVQESLN